MKILVVGELCQDVFVYGKCDRLCPEGPVPIFNPTSKKTNPGMAGNVVANLSALGHDCEFLHNKNKIVKTRYIEERSNQLLMRVDQCDKVKDSIEHLASYKDYDVIIISDYCKGFMTSTDIKHIASQNRNVMVDSKKILKPEWTKDVRFIKINEKEYSATKNTLKLVKDYQKKLIVTYGKEGCTYYGKRYPVHKKIDTIDISGAGDTFMAAFAVKFIETNDIIKSIHYAQKCTSIVVQIKGVATI